MVSQKSGNKSSDQRSHQVHYKKTSLEIVSDEHIFVIFLSIVVMTHQQNYWSALNSIHIHWLICFGLSIYGWMWLCKEKDIHFIYFQVGPDL